MKAVAARRDRRVVEVVEMAAPRLESETGVRLRMLQVGVCGTDAEICAFDYGGDPPEGEDRLVVGHEGLGRVIEVGARVTSLRPGDLAVPMVRRPCPVAGCPACRSGHPDFCVTGAYTERGIRGAHGFLAEEVVEEERSVVPLPGDLGGVGVLTEPLTIAEKALRQFFEVRRRLPWLAEARDDELVRGRAALVLGAGPVGLLGCLLLRLLGFEVTVYSRSLPPHPKVALVESVGASYLSAQAVQVGEIEGRVGRPDLIYEAAGASRLAFEALRVLAPNGVCLFTGVPGRKGQVEIAGDAIMRQLVLENQTALGTVNAGRADFEAAAADLARLQSAYPGALERVISGRHPMSRFCERAREGDGIKDVIQVTDDA